MRVSWDASDVGALVGELRRVPAEVERRNRATVKKSIGDITREWRAKARVTAGKHGRLYPGTIRSEIKSGGLSAVTGPLSALKQGGMGPGFEWGRPTTIKNPGTGPNGGGWWLDENPLAEEGEGGTWKPGGFEGQRVGQSAPGLDMTHTMDVEGPRFVEAAAGDTVPWW